jgi:uncharacterized protein YacL
MLNKNSILTGVLLSTIVPIISLFVAYLLRGNLYLMNKPALPYFIALAINLVMMRIIIDKGGDKTGRGIILGSVIFMILVFLFILHPIR